MNPKEALSHLPNNILEQLFLSLIESLEGKSDFECIVILKKFKDEMQSVFEERCVEAGTSVGDKMIEKGEHEKLFKFVGLGKKLETLETIERMLQ